MATQKKNILKNGRITYSAQAYITNSVSSKRKCHYTTWTNPDNLTGVRAEKAATAFFVAWENELRAGKTKTEISTALFSDIANEWLEISKPRMSASYYLRATDTVKRLTPFFGKRIFAEIKARDVRKFFSELNNYTFEQTSAKLKSGAKEMLDAAALAYGLRKADREGLHRPIIFAARKGEPISWSFAKEICAKYDLSIDKTFDKLHTVQKYKIETIMKYKRILSCIFNYAIESEITNINFASSVYLKKIIAGEKPKEIDILNTEEINQLLGALNKEHIMHSMPIYLMVMLGLRSCEAAGLEFKDIDWEKRILTVNRNRLYIPKIGVVTNDPKTKTSKRDLPICEALYQKLLECKAYYDILKVNNMDTIIIH